ncbi:MAG: DoxX family protein [Massilibacteroides sp.]|nr:DoxX family protein [Massilibacteroides sp.]MDD3062073.1 DoxX family protein [Massilibacteroides sp.]MDD4114103.1 DoxX family protein [Massilibacteroides sp.]MDD4659617.1 DoxX family protein [Massilibacteroides sp.]
MDYKKTTIKILAECCRLLIGLVFAFSGFVKAVDPVGWIIKINEYLSAFGLDALKIFSGIIAFNLSAIEFMLGICVLLGVYRRYSSFLVLLFMTFMTPLTLYLALFNPVSDCGCFGDAIVLTNWQTFYKNIVFWVATVFLFIYNQRILALFTFRSYWFVALYAYSMCVLFSYQNYAHLPVKDFRPYKIGANISALMKTPEGGDEDEYEYTFVYEKDGVEKEFSLNDYPADDPSWHFVETKSKLIGQGSVPPITDFVFFNDSDQEMTEEILANERGVLLLISPKLEKANDQKVDEINSLFDYAHEHQIAFYCVTASTKREIQKWVDRTGAEYPFLMGDEVVLKTIIRSNPGLVLLKNATIFAKWHNNDIPHEERIPKVLSDYLSKDSIQPREEDRKIAVGLLAFAVPLLFVWAYDFFRYRRKKKKEK